MATAIFSYLGSINFGYIADRHAFPDLPRLGECMEESFAELLAVARASQAGPDAATPSRTAARRKPGAKTTAGPRRAARAGKTPPVETVAGPKPATRRAASSSIKSAASDAAAARQPSRRRKAS